MIEAALALTCLAIWTYLIVLRGVASVMHQGPPPNPSPAFRRIVAIVPARDEAHVIGRAVSSLLSQTLSLEVIVVDDHSSDGTAEIAMKAGQQCSASGRLHVISAESLPVRWTGKMWAVSQGMRFAESLEPDYVLLTDADIEHAPGNVAQILARCERDRLDMASLMVKLDTATFAEKLLIPAFVFFFFKLYPPARVNNPLSNTAAAAGGCMLVRWTALQRIGGIASIKSELIDDCALARRIKRGGPIWLGVTRATHSIRPYEGVGAIWRMISRSAFTQLHYSALELAAAVVGMLLTYVMPFLLLVIAPAQSLAWYCSGVTILLMAAAYDGVLSFYGQGAIWALLLPVIAIFYTAATIDSALRYWRGAGGQWKGRVQATRASTYQVRGGAAHPRDR